MCDDTFFIYTTNEGKIALIPANRTYRMILPTKLLYRFISADVGKK